MRTIVPSESDLPFDWRFVTERVLFLETDWCEAGIGVGEYNYFLASEPSYDKKFVIDTNSPCPLTFKRFHVKNINNYYHGESAAR